MPSPSLQDEREFLRRQIEDLAVRLEDKIAELSVIKEMGHALGSIEDFDTTCRVILDVVLRNTLAQNFSIMLLDETVDKLYLIAASDPEEEGFVADVRDILSGRNRRYVMARGEGVAGRALAEERPILVEDVTQSDIFTTEIESRVPVGSLLAVPMFYQGKAAGVINASHRDAGRFKPHDLYLFNILADLVALLVQSSLAHQRLLLSEEKYRLLTENANDGIAIIQDRVHVYTNPRYRELTGYPDAELGKRTFESLFQPAGPGFQTWTAAPTTSGGRLQKGILTRADGATVEVEISLAPIEHQGREALLVSVRDLSYRKHLERQLRQFQKMEAIGTLAGGIAHDFNNVLAAILGYAELAVRRLPLSNPVHAYLQEILNAGDRARGLIRQILTFSRKTEQERAVIAIDPIVKESIKLLRSTIPVSVEIRQQVEQDCYVLAEATQVQQLVMNLAINASQAMQPGGGVMEIRLAKRDLADGEVAGVPQGQYVMLSVRDTGIGMDAATLERIFEPYFTTKEQGVGTGMGLAVVHGIVESYNGFITVDSQPGKGSVFTIFLPRAHPRRTILHQEGAATGGGEKILFVDDDESLAVMGAELLGEFGYRVTAVTSASEAMKYLQQQEHGFDCLITDEQMPSTSGTQLAAIVHAMLPDLPIILCTGNVDGIDAKAIEEAGIEAVVPKPFQAREIAAAIARCLGKSSPKTT